MKGLRVAVACIALCQYLWGSDPSAAWQKLGSVDHSNAYTIVLRDGSCQSSKIQNVEPDKLILQSGVTLRRGNIIYVGEGLSPHNILYSGRSSWYEVKEVKPGALESLQIRLKSGKSITGSFVSASDFDLTIKRFGHTANISKQDITQVSYIRFKPVSEAHKYFAQERLAFSSLTRKPGNTSSESMP